VRKSTSSWLDRENFDHNIVIQGPLFDRKKDELSVSGLHGDSVRNLYRYHPVWLTIDARGMSESAESMNSDCLTHS
jgi:hypothetical protein